MPDGLGWQNAGERQAQERVTGVEAPERQLVVDVRPADLSFEADAQPLVGEVAQFVAAISGAASISGTNPSRSGPLRETFRMCFDVAGRGKNPVLNYPLVRRYGESRRPKCGFPPRSALRATRRSMHGILKSILTSARH